jgi:hypothetical protein
MKVVTIAKLTTSTGKTKYFLDFMQASFHIQSHARGDSALQCTIESCVTLLDDSSYLALIKTSMQCADDIAKLAPNTVHHAYLKYIETDDGGGSGMGKSEGYTLITARKGPPTYSESYTDISIWIDEKRTIYKIDAPLSLIEQTAPEYQTIEPTISSALSRASARRTAEYQQSATYFGQRQVELQRAQEALEKAKQDMEAAKPLEDAMDFSQ